MNLKKFSVGDKIDIRILQEVLRNDEDETPKVYLSRIHDIISEDEIVVTMPLEGTKVILLPQDIRYELCFYNSTGLYICDGIVKERYKDGNIYVAVINTVPPLQKFQRREYYRLECAVDFEYYVIKDEEEKRLQIPKIVEEYHRKFYPRDIAETGIIVDISGGGIRGICKDKLETGDMLLIEFMLTIDGEMEPFLLLGKVVSCNKSERRIEKSYEARIEFYKILNKEREEIIKYIFQQDRKKVRN